MKHGMNMNLTSAFMLRILVIRSVFDDHRPAVFDGSVRVRCDGH